MNIPLLASEIVRRVRDNTDSVINLESTVSGLIREELKSSRLYHLKKSIRETNELLRDFSRDFGPK